MRTLRAVAIALALLASACSPPEASDEQDGAGAEAPSRSAADVQISRAQPPAGARTKARHVALAELNRRLPDADQRQIEGVAIQNTYPDGRAGLTVVIVYRDTRDCARSRCRALVTTDAAGRFTQAMQFTRDGP